VAFVYFFVVSVGVDLGFVPTLTPYRPTISTSPLQIQSRRVAGGPTDVVFAPADGTVRDVITHLPSPDVKVVVRATTTIVYYIDHLIPEVAISRGTQVTAGQRLGTTGSSFDSDLGVINDSVMLAFANPSRYGSEFPHTDAPPKGAGLSARRWNSLMLERFNLLLTDIRVRLLHRPPTLQI
jgi:hypothetical protein